MCFAGFTHPAALFDMKKEFSEQVRDFFIRFKGGDSYVKLALKCFLVLIVLGFGLDALSGFYILGNAKSTVWGVAGLIVVSIFYLTGEGILGWIGKKDSTDHPLHKRVYHLLMLLCSGGALLAVYSLIFKWLGW